ncbi:MAG: hypothetical protein IJX86_06625 [Lachnospiraceae bacterium]|nr:hypothetical protein [Lachnospiraceae bacterium]
MRDFTKRIVNFTIVYGFIILVFCVAIFSTPEESQGNRIETVISLLYLCVYPAYYFVIIYASSKAKKTNYLVRDFYIKQFPDLNALNKANDTVFMGGVRGAKTGVTIFSIYPIVCLLAIYWEYLIVFFEEIHTIIWEKDSLVAVIGVIVAIYAFLFAFYPIIVAKVNSECILFESQELPVIKRSDRVIVLSLATLLIYVIAVLFGVEASWRGAIEVAWIVTISISIMMYLEAFILPKKNEKNILKRIHHLYRTKRIYVTPNKRWYKGSVIRYIAKLLEEYEKTLRKGKFDNIEHIEFDSIVSNRKENYIMATKKYYIFSVCVIVIMLLFGRILSILGELGVQESKIYLLITMLAVLPLINPLIDKNAIKNNYGYINCIGANSSWGYYIKLANEDKNIYISSFGDSITAYQRLLSKIKRIVCFFNLAMNMKYEDADYIDDVAVDCLCAYVCDMSRKDRYTKGMIIPIMICGYLSENQRSENMKKIKKMLKHISVDKKEQEIAIEISTLIIRELYGDDCSFGIIDCKEELENLFSAL